MIDLHTHTFFSDGVLLPSELIQRARKTGYRAIALTDHADISNLESVIKSLTKVCNDTNKAYKDIVCLPGVELTHIPPVLVAGIVKKARALGAKMVVFHGETVTEPVEPGSNRAAIEAKVDILAHPGNISDEDAALAAKNNVCLEITARNGHNITNKHVAAAALKAGAKLVFDTDSHAPVDLADKAKREQVLTDAGLNKGQILQAIINSEELLRSKGVKI
ncbi:MAG: PHP domain-containing protein [Candidatus Goldiibacteriota bacterium HGW-Goldbacteria-1]|jgi:histidinol phosphatase-like PHP family hydrolase|nr:MAG: PHP domain-containing protein [Candidatus Goldiibacteriota bacterium HGW-Goldbacteria-1]